MRWLERLNAIEALEDAPLDAALVAEFERAVPAVAGRAIRFSTPTFKSYSSCELSGCGKNSFPAFSVTAGGCALMCDHCQAKILEPMIPATSPEMLEQKVREMVAAQDLGGFLLSGGSNLRNEIRYERYYPAVERLKRDFPHLKIAVHSALLDAPRARAMESAGVDTAMMDVIGAEETIREVYHLERPVEDFEATLAALCATRMQVVPHIVIGLHYGRILGEPRALDIVSRHRVHSLVLVVIMPFYAKPGSFATPGTSDVGRIFLEARRRVPDREVLLGCARPPGMHRRVTDAYAVMAGLDGIAFPADGAVAAAEAIGRPAEQEHACCSMKTGRTIEIFPSSPRRGAAAGGGVVAA
ncbi:MAG: radical SAM protein [Betaproteobacteria bacterium RIFCSPLOWO2_12_FULL_68_20]|nr:MAG: radical SAM protein [Betaproteobacteria bacterium RIFCSPLOWO2_12_FULL_68_20]